MNRLTFAALLSVVALVLLLATPHALLASGIAIAALLLAHDRKLHVGDTS